jgi:hypothetical protein
MVEGGRKYHLILSFHFYFMSVVFARGVGTTSPLFILSQNAIVYIKQR